MTWIPITLVATAILSVVSILDSHLISKRFISFRTFLIPAGSVHFVTGLIIMLTLPLTDTANAASLLVAFGAGIARVTAAFLMLRTMRSEEVTRIMPIINTFPIFVAIFSVPLLGEVLSVIEWMAIIITVSGAVLISVNWDSKSKGMKLRKSFISLILSSVLFGLANTGSKYALDYLSYWNMYGINALCIGGFFLLTSLRPRYLSEIRQMDRRTRTLFLTAFNELIATVGFVLTFWAIEQGPVSLVSTVTGTRPAFVFVYALLLSLFFPSVINEHFSRGVVITKVISIGMVIGGATLLSLSS